MPFLGEQTINLLTWPINFVRVWLKERSHAATIRQVAQRRKSMAGCQHFDGDMHRHLMRKRSEEERRTLLMIQSGGVWTAHTLFRTGYLPQDVCPWCGGAPETLEHLWWECPALEEHRKRIRHYVPLGKHRDLPACVALHGLPTELGADLDADLWRHQDTIWAEEDLECTPPNSHTRQNQPAPAAEEKMAWNYALVQIHEKGGSIASMTLRQLGEWLQDGFGQLPKWTIEAEAETAPEDINAYSDGSLHFGARPWAGLGAWGVFWPDELNKALPTALKGQAWSESDADATTWFGQIMGAGMSSARTEAFGLLAAIVTRGTAHVGIDNASVVRRLRRLRRQLAQGCTGRMKPWGLQADVDVWEAICDVISQKALMQWLHLRSKGMLPTCK